MAKLYDSHYKTEEQNSKLRTDEQKAQEEIEKMNKDGNVLVDEYKTLRRDCLFESVFAVDEADKEVCPR